MPARRRSFSRSSSFPEAIVACMVEGRRPTQREIALVAARIWHDSIGKAPDAWDDVRLDPNLYPKMVSAARFSLGDMAVTQEQSPVSATIDTLSFWRIGSGSATRS